MLLMIDNYDSFTYNLVQYFGDLGESCVVYRNDEMSADELIGMKPKGIIISPGPSNPDHSNSSLAIVKLAAETKTPLLGVCLGHQCIGQSFGSDIIRADIPMHGKVSTITHGNSGLFKGIPSPYTITRYHSLVIDPKTKAECLTVTAQTDDGTIMAVEHDSLPIHGVQFHPESIATEYGHQLLKNFVSIL